MKHVITRAMFEAAGPCTSKYFDARANAQGDVVYENGFDEAEVARVALDNPVGLMWLVSRRLVPTGAAEAHRAIEKAHGAPVAEVLKRYRKS